MRHLKLILRGSVALLPIVMAACSNRAADIVGGPAPGAPTPAPTVSFQSKFGTSFVSYFEASNTTEPRDPQAGDVPALSATSDPLDN